ncbi:MAG: aldose 1-epimerase family protein [Pirellulales bacterium]
MGTRTWNLSDLPRADGASAFHLRGNQLPTAAQDCQVFARRLHGGRSEGVDVVELDNGKLEITVLPTRGMGIWKAFSSDGRTLGWHSPIRGPVHPSFVPLAEPSGLGWLDGFDELFCRCGLSSNGEPEFDDRGRLRYGLHGRIANLPAHQVELLVDDATGVMTLRGVVDEARFHFQKLRLTSSVTVEPGVMGWRWRDRVENFGGTPAVMQMLYHFNIGPPLLAEGARLHAPVAIVAPRNAVAAKYMNAWQSMPVSQAGSEEQVLYFELHGDDHGDTEVMLAHPGGAEGVAIRFNKRALPCFAQWRNSASEADGYVSGLEPATNFPNTHSFERSHGRVVELAPGQAWEASVEVQWMTSAAEVDAAQERIAALADGRPTEVLTAPRRGWSP